MAGAVAGHPHGSIIMKIVTTTAAARVQALALATTLAAALAATLATTLATATPALAGSAPSVAVRYGDLDLSRPEGARALYTRLQAAAQRVCDAGNPGIAARRAARLCSIETLDAAVAAARSAHLDALHATRRTPASRVIAAR